MESPRELGIGVVYTPRLARVLDLSLVDVLEIEPQMFWRATGDTAAPIRIDFGTFSELRAMPQHKLVHSVSLPVGNSRPHDSGILERLRESIDALGSPYASEHLSFNRFDAGSERTWTGFFLPAKQDKHGVATAAARIDEMRRAVGVPIAFETGVNYLRPQPGEFSDGCYFRRVAEAADCGIVLDLHNLLTNERNGRASINAVFDEIPRERVWEIHLAGGMRYRGYWLDSHSGYIEEELLSETRAIVDACPNLRAIIFEVMDQYVDESSRDRLCAEIHRLRRVWTERRRAAQICVAVSPQEIDRDACQPATIQRREQTLGALALGWTPCDPEPNLVEDPAATLYADLVASMREGVIYETLPFLVRLLLVSTSHQATLNLISAFRAQVPPEQFGSDEARQFLDFVREQELPIDYLPEILQFEDAVIAVASGIEQRTVTFDCDPVALFAALVDRERPGLLARERFNIDISRSGIRIRNATRPETVS